MKSSVRKMKNGQYDIHLDFYDAYFIRNLLKNWCEYQKEHSPFTAVSQNKLLDELNAALYADEEHLKTFTEAVQNNSKIYEPEIFRSYLPENKTEFEEVPDYEEIVYPVSFSWWRDNAVLTCDAGNGYSKDIAIEPDSQACNFIQSQAWENKPMIITMHQVGFYTCGVKARFKE